ncbi:MAG: hypothetical protein ING25_10930 [Burkholderiales bacterium]|nr:hypothetical protein [Burkholderiales bacterium]
MIYPADRKREQQRAAYYRRKEDAPAKVLLSTARKRARERNQEFNIELTDVVVPATCPLLGIPLAPGVGKIQPGSPSLDRIDSSKGYVKGNVWVISHKANIMKSDASMAELLVFAKAITKLHDESICKCNSGGSDCPADGTSGEDT